MVIKLYNYTLPIIYYYIAIKYLNNFKNKINGNLIVFNKSKQLSKRSSTAKTRPQTASVSILTTSDFERIRKNAKLSTQEEELNNKKILAQQKNCQFAKAQAHKDRLAEIDKLRKTQPVLSEAEKEDIIKGNSIIAQAKRAKENNEDAVKEMDQMLKYAKVVTIRDIQKREHKQMEEDYKKKELKLDTMMELERLKELKLQEERERSRKIQQREGAMIIVDQIKERELERLKQREVIAKEREMMNRQIQELEEQDRRIAEKKKLEAERLAKEVESINKISALNRDKKKLAEKELDLKIHQYNIEKAKKEEEELAERKRIRDEKEKETQRLREKQERAQDKQAELDAIRAKRAFEEAERKAREKEKQEILKKQRQMNELIEANEIQKLSKGMRLKEQAKQDEEEYQYIVKNQMREMEIERRLEEERKKMRYEHNDELKRQIKEKEEKERIKREKIEEMHKLNIDPKYRVDLEKYKIK